MTDNLKNFIQKHHSELDVAEPSQVLWDKIETQIDLNGTKWIKSKWLSKLKYFGFSASVLFILVLLYKYNSNANSSVSVKKESINAVIIKEETTAQDKKEIVKNSEVIKENIEPQKQVYISKNHQEFQKESQNGAVSLSDKIITTKAVPQEKKLNDNSTVNTNSSLTNWPGKQMTDENRIAIDTLFTGIKRLEINVSVFDINVRGRKNDTIRLNGEINTEAHGLIVNKMDQTLKYDRKDSILVISVERKGKHILIAGSFQQEAILNIDVPESIDLIINNEFGNDFVTGLNGRICNIKCNTGDVKISDIRSEVSLQTNTGNLFVNMINGNLKAEASYGDIEIEELKGSNCRIRSTTGNVKLTNVNSDLDLEIGTGDVFFNSITGNLKVESSFGIISIEKLKGKTCSVKNNTGDVKIIDIVADIDLQVNTGNLMINKVEGNVNVGSSYGDIEISDIKGKRCMIKGNSGNIKLSEINSDLDVDIVTGDVKLNSIIGSVKSKTSYGNQLYENISGDLQIINLSGDIKMKKVTGNLNIVSSYGNVHLDDVKGIFSINASSGDIIGKNIELTNNSEFKTTYGNVRLDLKNDLNELGFDLEAIYGEIKIKKKDEILKGKEGKLIITAGKITITGNTQTGDQLYE